MSEHDFEPIRGLPGNLPPGESLLWQGAPDWWALAQRAFHVRSVALYFAILMVWRIGAAALAGAAPLVALQSALTLAPIALASLGLLCALAALTARTTVYTITSKRVVLRFGIALPKAINLPFAIIESAALKDFADRSGDLALTLSPPNKVAYLLLWPHARPWKLARPQPTMRAIANAKAAASVLAQALNAAHASRGATAAAPDYAPVPTPQAAMSPA